jgi:hypothetical protein
MPLDELLDVAGINEGLTAVLLGGYFGSWLRPPDLPSDSRMRHAAALAVGAIAALSLAGCGAGSRATTSARSRTQAHTAPTTATVRPVASPAVVRARPRPVQPSYPRLLDSALASQPTPFVPVVNWHGQTAARVARSPSGIALLSFNQRLLELRLHSGTTDVGATGWRFGPSIAGSEMHHLAAAFNGGFKLTTDPGGFTSYGRVAVPLRYGLGSIVTYADGRTDIGSWGSEVPAPGHPVVSVRQNLPLLIDHGSSASNLNCLSCWGATLSGVIDPARSALGITAEGLLIWAGGEHLTVSALADALLGVGVVRAVQLDINPAWVAGYLYGHRGGKGPLTPVPVVPGQVGISGQYLAPWSRDFFTVEAR